MTDLNVVNRYPLWGRVTSKVSLKCRSTPVTQFRIFPPIIQDMAFVGAPRERECSDASDLVADDDCPYGIGTRYGWRPCARTASPNAIRTFLLHTGHQHTVSVFRAGGRASPGPRFCFSSVVLTLLLRGRDAFRSTLVGAICLALSLVLGLTISFRTI